jgi:hypothetical protein
MDIFTSSTAMIGVIGCIGLAGWSMGRLQGLAGQGQVTSDLLETDCCPETTGITSEPPALTGLDASHCHGQFRDTAMALSDMHAEITKFRRREQVLATLYTEVAMFDRRSSRQLAQSRNVDPLGTQPAAETPDPVLAPQPSPGASTLTRV